MTFSPKERARQKAAARARDEERLERGEISPSELQRENAHFARHLSSLSDTITIGIPKRGNPKERWTMTITKKARESSGDPE